MSFLENNVNFLRFGFDIPLRGLSDPERSIKYSHGIKDEARRRIKTYFKSVKDSSSRKTALYKELLEKFGSLEGQFLVYSIYFDTDSDALISELSPSVLRYLNLESHPLKGLFELKISRYEGSLTKGYLKDFFTGTLKLSPGEWEDENGSYNPVTNKLTAWLINSISANNTTGQTIETFVLNYTKLWNIYFASPYNYTQALIVMHKVLQLYKALEPQKISIDFYPCLLHINNFLNELLPAPINSPITDLDEGKIHTDATPILQPNVKSYLTKVREFQSRLKTNTIFFQDLAGQSWSELLWRSCTETLPARIAYLEEITKRHKNGRTPSFKDINVFMEKILKDNNSEILDRKMVEKVTSENYLFFL